MTSRPGGVNRLLEGARALRMCEAEALARAGRAPRDEVEAVRREARAFARLAQDLERAILATCDSFDVECLEGSAEEAHLLVARRYLCDGGLYRREIAGDPELRAELRELRRSCAITSVEWRTELCA